MRYRLALLGSLLFAASAAQAMQPSYALTSSQFPGFGRIVDSPFDPLPDTSGSGTVISTRHVLVALHSVWDIEELGNTPPNPAWFKFHTDANPTVQYQVTAMISSRHFYPDSIEYEGALPDEYTDPPIWNVGQDLCILEFAENSFPSSWVVPIFEGEVEVGMNLLRLGCGYTGYQEPNDPSQWTQILASQGPRRWGYNKVSRMLVNGTQWGNVTVGFWSDYDGYVPHANPEIEELVLIDHFSDGGPVEYEVCYRTYDSGGPTLIWDDGQWKICAVHSSSDNDFGGIVADHGLSHMLDFVYDNID